MSDLAIAVSGLRKSYGDLVVLVVFVFLRSFRATAIPAVNTFLTWIQKVAPGFKADLYTLYGWTSAELFTQALEAAGPNPTRGSVLEQLRKITSFNAGNLLATGNPAGKVPASCYIIGRIVKGEKRVQYT